MIPVLKEIIADPRFLEGVAWNRHCFESNEVVIREGDHGHSIFFVEEGELRVTGRVELEGSRHLQPGIWDLQAGDLFGELCLFESSQRSASVITLTDGKLVEIDGERLSRYLDENPGMGYRVLKELFNTLVSRLNRANKRVEHLFAWGLKAHGIDQHL